MPRHRRTTPVNPKVELVAPNLEPAIEPTPEPISEPDLPPISEAEPITEPTPEPTPENATVDDAAIEELVRRSELSVAHAVAIAQNAFDAEDARKDGYTLFVTVDEFGSKRIDVHLGPGEKVRGTYDPTRTRVQFRVPDNLLERFERHEFVRMKRIVRVS